ncbi:response regulator transcription factor [Microbacterium sp.]|uniref:response regulator transcription factor n=1 Tax=Microbacterium sp. TaxID=51671 RepID=UPI003F7020E7
MALRILTVEDEPEMADLIARGLRGEGYVVDVVTNGVDAISLATDGSYDIAILDVMLPGMSGFEICRWLRRQHEGLAILMLTARDAVDDRVRGLDAGADDYLVKPFEFAELAARLRALRRRDVIGTARIDVGGLSIDMLRHEISAAGKELRVSRTEFDLLRLLASNVGRALPRTEILDSVWGSASYVDPNIVDQYISYVRRKLDAANAPVRIATTRGVGFELIPDET